MTALAQLRSHQHAHLTLMLALTFSTGVIDAVGFLGLDRVFVGNMTGNVVILGMGLVGADDLPVAGPALALVGFMVGAAGAGRALRRKAHGTWAVSTTVVLAAVGVIVLVVAIVTAVVTALSYGAMIAITTLLGAAMGMQAAAARAIAVKDVTTVVVTSSITGLAADSWFGANNPGNGVRRIAAVAVLLLGAALGAFALTIDLGLGLFISAVVILAVAAAGAVPVRATSEAVSLPQENKEGLR